jgi:dolichyl-phosphate beta-glucosyltransferase
MLDLSVIIPVYKSADFIEKNLVTLDAFLKGLSLSYELICVDDASPDRSSEIMKGLALPSLKIFRQGKNTGKGGAVRRGMLEACGAFRIFTDADLPYELDAFETALKYLDFKEFDLVIGDRTNPKSFFVERKRDLRKIISSLYTLFVSRMVVTGVKDTQCGFKGFRADAAEKLFGMAKISSFAFDVELLYLSYKLNLDMKRIPVKLVNDQSSTVNLFRDPVIMARDLFVIIASYYAGRYPI